MSQVLNFPTLTTDQEEAKENARRTAIFISKISSLISSRRFHAYVASNASRFEWASERIFDRLRFEFFLQVSQGCNIRMSEDVPYSQQLWLTSAVCNAEVERLTKAFDLKLRKKDTAFVVPRSADFEDEVYKLSQMRPPAPRMHDSQRPFYLWNTIDALILFVESRRTLSVPTGHIKFDQFLCTLDEDYLLSGYPHDILVHEVKSVTSRPDKVIGLALKKDWCSTWTIENREDPRLHDPSYRFVNLATR